MLKTTLLFTLKLCEASTVSTQLMSTSSPAATRSFRSSQMPSFMSIGIVCFSMGFFDGKNSVERGKYKVSLYFEVSVYVPVSSNL